jgi:hypothetical protein
MAFVREGNDPARTDGQAARAYPLGVRRQPGRYLSLLLAAAIRAMGLLSGCAGPALPASPAADRPCAGQDPSGPGYYPDLEKRLPASWRGKPSSSLVSGRYCSAKALGSLKDQGIGELRFAAAEWVASDNESSLTMLVYQAPGLTASMLSDQLYAAAKATSGAQVVTTNNVTIAGRPGVRIDAALSSSRQARIVWPSSDAGLANAVFANGVTDDAIASAEAAFAS